MEDIIEIKVYLHRTKKKQFEVCDCFTVDIDFDKLPEDKKNDLAFINEAFENDCQKIAMTRDCIKKYGTGYISFVKPKYEGPEDKNGTKDVYFDNEKAMFVKRSHNKKEISK